MPEQTILTADELDAMEVSVAIQELLLDQFPEYPLETWIKALIINIRILSKNKLVVIAEKDNENE